MEWHTIETAPGEGKTVVLLWYPDVKRYALGVTHTYPDGEKFAVSAFEGCGTPLWVQLTPPK